MKFMLLTAAAFIAAPAIAQDTTMPAPTDQTMPMGTDTTMPDTTTATDPAAPATTMSPSTTGTMAPSTTMSTTGTTSTMPTQPAMAGEDPVGGYQPANPPMSGMAQPGATVNFVQAPSPSEAYPAPAPMKSYPICKAGQYDNCMQRGGR